MRLSRDFENLAPALKTVVSRWRRGVYREDQRPREPVVQDERGRVIRSIGKAQTFLTEAQIDQVVALYEGGMSMEGIAQKFRAHRRTIAAQLVRRGKSLGRYRRVQPGDIAEAAEMYRKGMTLAELGRRFGVSQSAVKTAVTSSGVLIRPRGRASSSEIAGRTQS